MKRFPKMERKTAVDGREKSRIRDGRVKESSSMALIRSRRKERISRREKESKKFRQ